MNPVENALDELRQALLEFVSLLEQESQALRDNQTETLADVVVEKSHWAGTVNTAWNRLVVASGIDPARGDSLDATLSANPAWQASWRDVRQLAEQAERINRGNGALIEAQLQRTRLALDVLQSAAHRGALYGANGRIVDGLQSGHTLDKA
jgi:flagellar biosynthesis/type III secretory pathway chaperone